ncbi:hypothetical protein AZOA_12120 [Azoarcus sp. Aa7]|nr:hypothetical protein [Azoarcus sp. Aa7]
MMKAANWCRDGQLREYLRPTNAYSSKPNDLEEDHIDVDAILATLGDDCDERTKPAPHTAGALPQVHLEALARKTAVVTLTGAAVNAESAASDPATTEPTEGTVSRAPTAPYIFPHRSEDFQRERVCARDTSNEDLTAALLALIGSLDRPFTPGTHTRGYLAARAQACALAITLNERQAMPPVLREWINLNMRGAKLTHEQETASNDLQVIDLHWLHESGFRPLGPKASRVFGDQFNFDEAATFVSTMGDLNNKATLLGLTRHEMLLLKMIGTRAARQRQQDIRKLIEELRGRIRAALKEPQCRQRCSDADMVHTCHALLLADGDPNRAMAVAEQAFDLELGKQQMTRRQRWLLDRKFIHSASPRSASAS